MRSLTSLGYLSLLLATLCLAGGLGCKKGEEEASNNDAPTNPVEEQNQEGVNDGWWCVGHGIPESKCSMCSATYAAECKEKGDWCEEHNRALSNCFVCNPELEEEFAKDYERRYGSRPPEINPDAEHHH